jgi:hypothetical protein
MAGRKRKLPTDDDSLLMPIVSSIKMEPSVDDEDLPEDIQLFLEDDGDDYSEKIPLEELSLLGRDNPYAEYIRINNVVANVILGGPLPVDKASNFIANGEHDPTQNSLSFKLTNPKVGRVTIHPGTAKSPFAKINIMGAKSVEKARTAVAM